MPIYRDDLPQLGDQPYLADSGLETDLIFHRGVDLPEFAAFVALDSEVGRQALIDYYSEHIDVASAAGCGLVLETATWRASSGWAERMGLSAEQLAQVNRAAVAVLTDLRTARAAELAGPLVVSGCIGPREDAYNPGRLMSTEQADRYHSTQIEALALTDVDMVHAMTITYAAEATGIARAAARYDVPVAISFTTETDGQLPNGTPLEEAIAVVDGATRGYAAYFGVNCAHPTHFADALGAGHAVGRIRCIRANASRKSHRELDESTELDEGDPGELAELYSRLRDAHPQITVLGGCCGTDTRHIAAIAAACL
jgi:S-methylmethionine-dependent homocysteine/selenocysteine methylase